MEVEPCRPCGSSARDILQGGVKPQTITVSCPTVGTEHTDATKNDFFFQDTAPTCTNPGDIWVETDFDPPRIHECDGTSWQRSSYSGMADMIGQVEGTQISDLSIDSTHIMDNAIITRAIAAEQILAGHIASSEISAGHITAGAIDANKISTLYLNAAEDAQFGTGNTRCIRFEDAAGTQNNWTAMRPSADATCLLGTSAYKWSSLYSQAVHADSIQATGSGDKVIGDEVQCQNYLKLPVGADQFK